jgi:hypothetical protein
MIVLDEQLARLAVRDAICRWYSGKVVAINDLRPGTVIKDEAIPSLLARHGMPTFVTLNSADFWQRVPITDRFCVVCVALPGSRTAEVSLLLRRLLRHPLCRNRARRMGHVFRVVTARAQMYSVWDPGPRQLPDW